MTLHLEASRGDKTLNRILGFDASHFASINSELLKFAVEYLKQTRSEVESEKRERNVALNAALVVLSGFILLLTKYDTKPLVLLSAALSATVMIFSLFSMRRTKLEQMALRWYVLYNMLIDLGAFDDHVSTIEFIVWKQIIRASREGVVSIFGVKIIGFHTFRNGYVAEDAKLYFLISLPLLVFIEYTLWEINSIHTIMGDMVGVSIFFAWLLTGAITFLQIPIPEQTVVANQKARENKVIIF